MHVFEYAVVRLVPRVEREEFINVGVILFCAKLKYLHVLFQADEIRMAAFAPGLDLAEIKANLNAFKRICLAEPNSGAIGKLDAASRFRWLTATRSTVIQSSKVHPGLCTDAEATLIKLYQQLIL
ncbi:MAG: DUF3037 domain-containing protein [Sphingobacteriaceae bacterium]|nr:MAG: DUF3037 domain-containing protein [Sphingobacteriaceae bacterium]